MALDATNVHVGPMRIFLNVTNPASGLPPTAITHVLGVPTPGDDVGYTQGDATFRHVEEIGEVMAEQATGPIMVFQKSERVEVEFTMLEQKYQSFKMAFGNVTGSVNSGGRTMFYSGSSSPQPVRTQSVMFSSLRPNFAGKYQIGVLYKAYNVSGVELPYRRQTETLMKVTLRALYDSSRNDGDQYFQWYQEF